MALFQQVFGRFTKARLVIAARRIDVQPGHVPVDADKFDPQVMQAVIPVGVLANRQQNQPGDPLLATYFFIVSP